MFVSLFVFILVIYSVTFIYSMNKNSLRTKYKTFTKANNFKYTKDACGDGKRKSRYKIRTHQSHFTNSFNFPFNYPVSTINNNNFQAFHRKLYTDEMDVAYVPCHV